ncbi:MAG: hypothetical protein ACXVZI_06090, partial [Terriglobales bacterium]
CRRTAIPLPVAFAAHLHALFHGEPATLGWRQQVSPRQKMAGERLRMPTPQPASWHKWVAIASLG